MFVVDAWEGYQIRRLISSGGCPRRPAGFAGQVGILTLAVIPTCLTPDADAYCGFAVPAVAQAVSAWIPQAASFHPPVSS